MPRPLEYLIRNRSVSVAPWLFTIALVLAGCDGPAATGPPGPDAGPTPCVPGQLTREDGTCQPAGLPPDMLCDPGELLLEDGITCQPAGLPPDMPCPPGELPLGDGACQKAGVPPSACGLGFLPDGKDGCEPILPADPCPEGLMAVPGDTACHEVAPCGSGTWGDIPVEANTQFVDKAYAGGNSDGTQAKPWTSIQPAVNKATKGAIVAVAAGSYAEDVVIQGKAVRLWGRCPTLVEVAGTGAKVAAIQVLQKAAGGAEIHGVAITGAQFGIGVSGATGVVIEGVWIHGTGGYGLDIEDDLGLTSVVLKGSLLEQNHKLGVLITGSDVTIEATSVRSTLPNEQGSFGRGINAQPGFTTKERASLTVRACVIEQNHEAGVYVSGSDATIEATVVRSTLPNTLGGGGRGINIEDDLVAKIRAKVTVRASLVEQNHEAGVIVAGSDATIEATVVRSTLPNAQAMSGNGIVIQDSAKERSNVAVLACLVEQNRVIGVEVKGSNAMIEGTVVRSTLPNDLGEHGRGIQITDGIAAGERTNVTVRGCLIEQNQDMGVFVFESDATIEATVVRGTLPDAQGNGGRGIGVEDDPDTNERANVAVRACLIEQNHDLGVFVAGSDATIEATVVRSTVPSAQGNGGRGISVQNDAATKVRANVTVRGCLVEQNHDIGVFVGGSDATIEGTVVSSTLPTATGLSGAGIVVQADPVMNERANVTVRGCLVEQSYNHGVFVSGSHATIEATLIRATLSDDLGEYGRGIGIQFDPDTKSRADVTVHGCLLEQNHDIGVFVMGSDATIEATVVRGTLPKPSGEVGRGINIQSDKDSMESSSATVRGCVVEQNHDIGVYVSSSDAAIVDSIVRDTDLQKSDDRFGDGIAVFFSAAAIQNVEVTQNARAGIASFAGHVVITGGVITCNAFDLEGEPMDDIPFSFDGSTGWQCSDKAPAPCAVLGDCHVETAGIEAPSDLPPADPLPP
jgi:hypothetical protein